MNQENEERQTPARGASMTPPLSSHRRLLGPNYAPNTAKISSKTTKIWGIILIPNEFYRARGIYAACRRTYVPERSATHRYAKKICIILCTRGMGYVDPNFNPIPNCTPPNSTDLILQLMYFMTKNLRRPRASSTDPSNKYTASPKSTI